MGGLFLLYNDRNMKFVLEGEIDVRIEGNDLILPFHL